MCQGGDAVNHIKELSKSHKVKLVNLAQKAQLSNSHLHDIISGKKNPSLKIAQRIADVLESSIEEVFPNEKYCEDCKNEGGKL